MPIAGLGVTGLSDLIGMRNALGIAAVCFGIGAFIVLTAAGPKRMRRHQHMRTGDYSGA